MFKFIFEKFLADLSKGDKNSLIYQEWIFNRGENKGAEYIKTNLPEQVVVDYIASMTDRYFYDTYKECKK